jgi:hypothetical protein
MLSFLACRENTVKQNKRKTHNNQFQDMTQKKVIRIYSSKMKLPSPRDCELKVKTRFKQDGDKK